MACKGSAKARMGCLRSAGVPTKARMAKPPQPHRKAGICTMGGNQHTGCRKCMAIPELKGMSTPQKAPQKGSEEGLSLQPLAFTGTAS
eukprot:1152935-Pelagomonas_calceolata.AAC.1